MKKLIIVVFSVLTLMVLSGCESTNVSIPNTNVDSKPEVSDKVEDIETVYFVDDVENYLALEESLEKYNDLFDFEIEIENVSSAEIDQQTLQMIKQYSNSLEYNTKMNEYYGFNYSDLVEMMGDQKYVFDVDANGNTIYTEQVTSEDPFKDIMIDVAIGTGVIVLCVTLNVITAGSATPVACFISGAAVGAVKGALIGAASGGVISGLVSLVATGDIDEALFSAMEGAADGYKIGAISGALMGGLFNTNCFVEGTQVTTQNGLVDIEEINSEDKVLSMNDKTFEVGYNEVVQTFTSTTNYLTTLNVGDEVISTTPEHLFYVNNLGWKQAKDLSIGDVLINSNNDELIVSRVSTNYYEDKINTYNFEVANDHTYFVSELEVYTHNVCTNHKLAGTSTTKSIKRASGAVEDITISYSKLNKAGQTFANFNKYVDPKYTAVFDDLSVAAYRNGTCLTGTSKDMIMYKNHLLQFFKSTAERDAFLKNYAMHHMEDMKTMVLVPREIHEAFRHTGGASLIRNFFGF